MSFDTREASVHDGAPVLLFEFSRGPAVWRYTNCGVDYTLGGIVYTDVPGFTDDTISQSGDATRDAVNLVVPASLGVVSHYLQSRPTTRMRLVIRSVHFGDTATADAEIEWIGYVVGIKRSKIGQRTITCNSIAATFGRPGLRLCWSRGCPYVVFDYQCGLNPDDWAVPATLTALDGNTITAAALASAAEDGYFTGGIIRWTTDDGIDETRGLDLHDRAAGTCSVYGGTSGMTNGQAVTLYPGCDYTVATCNRRFDNRLNCGAHKGQPGKSPFDGNEAF